MDSAPPRPLEQLMEVELPPDIWDGRGFTNIYCAVLFADLENSVQISRIISPEDYDQLIDEFQSAMLRAVAELHMAMELPKMEVNQAGDQLAVFFFNEDAVKFNWLLDNDASLTREERKSVILAYSKSNADLTLTALKVAVYLKSAWLSNAVNIERISHHREPIGLALGVHADKVFLRNRADGKTRVEGYTVNLAKRVESFSRNGIFSRIMFSQAAANTIRGTILKHSQLRQRIFFHKHVLDSDQLKGLGRTEIYELKFFHRIGIPQASDRLVDLYDKILSHDPTNIWAYYQLSAHYALKKDYRHLERLARRILLIYPRDEKVVFDLGLYYLQSGMLGQATSYFQQALQINPELDLAYEFLAVVYDTQRDYPAAAENARRALLLSPGSPINQMNLGLALCDIQEYVEADHHLCNALETYPPFLSEAQFQSTIYRYLRDIRAHGAMSTRLYDLITQLTPQIAASIDEAVAPDVQQVEAQ